VATDMATARWEDCHGAIAWGMLMLRHHMQREKQQCDSPAETSQCDSPAETSQCGSPAETSQCDSPAETSQLY
jgi:hypothetical protein